MTDIPGIYTVDDPFGATEPKYSEVNFDYFYKHRKKTSEMSGSTLSSSSPKKRFRFQEGWKSLNFTLHIFWAHFE